MKCNYCGRPDCGYEFKENYMPYFERYGDFSLAQPYVGKLVPSYSAANTDTPPPVEYSNV